MKSLHLPRRWWCGLIDQRRTARRRTERLCAAVKAVQMFPVLRLRGGAATEKRVRVDTTSSHAFDLAVQRADAAARSSAAGRGRGADTRRRRGCPEAAEEENRAYAALLANHAKKIRREARRSADDECDRQLREVGLRVPPASGTEMDAVPQAGVRSTGGPPRGRQTMPAKRSRVKRARRSQRRTMQRWGVW